MGDFLNKRFDGVIIAVAALLVCLPVSGNAAEQIFSKVSAIVLGPQPVALTMKTSARKDIAVDTNVLSPDAPGEGWITEADGTLRFKGAAEISRTPVAITITLPEGWSGQLRCIGQGHRLSGQDLKLDRWQVDLLGGGIQADWSGSVNQMQVNATGSVQWRAAGLKATILEWNGSGEGTVQVQVTDRLTSRLVGRFNMEYAGNPRVKAIQSVGQSKAKSSAPSSGQ